MGIDVFVESQVHDRRFAGVDVGQLLERLMEEAPLGILQDIDPDADTMFNVVQLRRFVEDLNAIRKIRPDLADAVFALHDLAEVAIRSRGYLWFAGD